MTDKENRTLKNGVIAIFDKFNILDQYANIGGLKNGILRLIGSMPVSEEEPKFKVGQSIRQGDEVAKIVEVSEEGYHCDAFVPFTAQDSWELVEEPVSEDLLDTTQTITYNGEVYTRCYKDKLDAFACEYPMSVSKTSKRYAKYSDFDLTIAVKEGAKLQKEKDKEEWLDKALDFFGSNYNSLIDGGVIGAFDDKEKMIEEFVEFMNDDNL